MICKPCKDKRCVMCDNITRLGTPHPATGQYCDCQHQPPYVITIPDGGK